MANYNFDAEMDLLAEKIPDFYEDTAVRRIRTEYRMTWIGIKIRAVEKVFGTSDIPKIATEEHISQVKELIRKGIESFPDLNEETEPAE